MAATINDRDTFLQAEAIRQNDWVLGDNVSLDYDNISGTKPPAGATANFFSTSASNPTGGVDGDAHWNSATQVMWFKTGGSWNPGGTVNASQITVGILAAARIAADSIEADKLTTAALNVLENSGVTLSSSGALLGAGGGTITALDYGNVSGTKPPANATQNIFSTSTSNPTGGVDGDAHWNSNTSTMWFKTGGVWRVGGTINAGQITVGTLAAARIAANSITSDKINVSTISAITANLGTVNAGSITGSAGIDITGLARFNAGFGLASLISNNDGTNDVGILSFSSSSSLATAIIGQGVSGGGNGVRGFAVNASSSGVVAEHSGTGTALRVLGKMTINNSTLVANLRAHTCVTADNATNATNATNANNANLLQNNAPGSLHVFNSSNLGNVAAANWARIFPTNSGTAFASGSGMNIRVTGTLNGSVQTRGTGNTVFIENISDENLKKDIVDETYGLDFINSLTPRQFRMIANPDLIAHGFIAQEVKPLLSHKDDSLSSENPDGTKSFDYNGIASPIVKSIQELSAKLEAALARIEILENQT